MNGAGFALRPARIDVHVLRHPIAVPVRTSFGAMHDRPAVLVRVEDVDGASGWGETWCNFPACGAEHRGRLIETVIAPLLIGRRFESAVAAFEHLSASTAVLALQTGEFGPIAQAIAGVDLALWDLLARRAGVPLWRFLGGTSDEIAVYASGLNPDAPERLVERKYNEGYRAFKLKVGFGLERDLTNLRAVRAAAGRGGTVMIDANQAWDLAEARANLNRFEPLEPAWIEEPLRADRPWSEWRELRRWTSSALAAGENIAGTAAFEALLAEAAVDVVQPDVAKWGGHSGCRPLVGRIRSAGRRFCPHYLGAGIGLLHSAHLLAASGHPEGALEVDANDNPLRTAWFGALRRVTDGRVRLGEAPGIGVTPEPALLASLAPAA